MKLQKFAKTHTNLQITFADIIPKSKTSIMSKPYLAVFTKEEEEKEKDKATIKTKNLMGFYSSINKKSPNIKNSKEKQKRSRR